MAAAQALACSPGAITEITGDRGPTSWALHMAARCRERIAWLDPNDRLDPATAQRAGLDLRRLLWVRGGGAVRALRAAQLVVQTGGFGLIVLDLLDQPERELRLPRAAWYRLLRGLERERRTEFLVLARRPLASTCAERVIRVDYTAARWNHAAGPLLEGADIEARLETARRGDKRPPVSTPQLQAEVVA